jgi:hypothetical protein
MRQQRTVVMPGLDPGIHDFLAYAVSEPTGSSVSKTWMAGSSPAMTARGLGPFWRGCALQRSVDSDCRTLPAVIPAKAGIHIPEAGVPRPRPSPV